MLGGSVLKEEWLRQLWEQTLDALVLSDAQGVVLAANSAYYRLYGYGPDEVLGKSFALIFPTDQRQTAEAMYRDIFQSDQPPPLIQSVVRNKSGVERTVESRASFVEDAQQRRVMLSIIRDVTEEVVARRAADRAERDLRGFLASLSHDIKSPLAVIKGHAQVMRRHIVRHGSAPPRERLVDALAQIESSALRVADLVDEILEVATLQDGASPPLHPSAADLMTVVRDTVGRHQRLTEQHELVIGADVESLPGIWDVPRLVRVLDNLLGNAVKYSPNGGLITVRVNREATQCGGVVLSIEDSGIGIAAEDLPHVFDRYHRGTNVPETVVGSGIGLTSVEQIVHQHGGRIDISSRVGAGTRVTVWLPVRSEKVVDAQ